jgi:hypothetical protein
MTGALLARDSLQLDDPHDPQDHHHDDDSNRVNSGTVDSSKLDSGVDEENNEQRRGNRANMNTPIPTVSVPNS